MGPEEDAAAAAGEFCNASVALPNMTRAARAFDLPKFWEDMCQRVAPQASRARHWGGKNWCWEWVKHEGCYAAGFNISWYDAQVRAAKQLLAPYPEIVPMEPLLDSGLCEHYSYGKIVGVEQDERDAAIQWMTDSIDVYVINLPQDQDRLKAISRHLWDHSMQFFHWPGVDLTAGSSYQTAKQHKLVPWGFNFTRALEQWRFKFRAPGGLAGSMGRSAAHLSVMRHAARRWRRWQRRVQAGQAGGDKEAPLILVLEDDARLEADFAVKLRRMLEHEAPCDWVAINLRSMCPYGECVAPHLTRVRPDGNEPEERCRHGVNYGFEAVLYRATTIGDVEARLRETVWNPDRPHCLDIDVALASVSGEVAYYAVPGLQEPGFLNSKPSPHSIRGTLNTNTAGNSNMEQEQKNMDQALDLQEAEEAYAYRLKLERQKGVTEPPHHHHNFVYYQRTSIATTTTSAVVNTTITATTTSTTALAGAVPAGEAYAAAVAAAAATQASAQARLDASERN